MTYQKGPDLLIEAIPLILEEHKDAKFIFAGEGDMSCKCRSQANKLGLDGKCTFLGYVSRPENLINNCDIVCVPSRNEPFGIIVLEAWDAGKPVVATDAISIVRNAEDGLIATMHPESIARQINQLLNRPDKIKELGQAGQKRIDAEFGWNQIAEITEKTYDEVLRTMP
jgi:glycosyltransferase involved in cell wall biosynthesis